MHCGRPVIECLLRNSLNRIRTARRGTINYRTKNAIREKRNAIRVRRVTSSSFDRRNNGVAALGTQRDLENVFWPCRIIFSAPPLPSPRSLSGYGRGLEMMCPRTVILVCLKKKRSGSQIVLPPFPDNLAEEGRGV